jgi:hypothetical protein
MERAPLRPVPARPAGPVDPVAAAREVVAVLPALAPHEARALALVALADRPRAEVAGALGIDEEELARILAAGRKELRQTITPLAGSGWCERAEGLISDRLDGVMREADARRLDVHLRNCTRCVEHERRLVQATDALLAGIAPRRPGSAPAALTPAPLVPVEDEGEPEPPGAEAAPPGPEAGPDAAPPSPAPAVAEVALAQPPTSEQIAAAAEVLVTPRTRRQLAAAVSWNAMLLIAVVLTIASIALILAGIFGAQL